MLIVFNHYLVSIRNYLSFVINYDIKYKYHLGDWLEGL